MNVAAATVRRAGVDSDQGALQKVPARIVLRPIKQLMTSRICYRGVSLNQDVPLRMGTSLGRNPIEVRRHLPEAGLERRLAGSGMILDHDHAILSDAEDFYTELGRFDTDDWAAISELLAGSA